MISIHTSAKEVTNYTAVLNQKTHFNPHFREGSDCSPQTFLLPQMHFNPHFREGSDNQSHRHTIISSISIHTSAKEVTGTKGIFFQVRTSISIHTSAKEVTSSFVIALSSVPDFNPHFREGSDVPGSPYPRSQ